MVLVGVSPGSCLLQPHDHPLLPLAEVAAPWTEETIKQCLYLYLALLPQNHKLIHELASVYTEAIADIKRTVLRVIEQPVSTGWGWRE